MLGVRSFASLGMLMSCASPAPRPPPGDSGIVDPPPCLQQEAIESGQLMPLETDITFSSTFAATSSAPAPTAKVPATLDDTAYYGAVDPNGPAFWEGWTVVHPDIDGGFPGAAFHPLRAEIEGGTLTPRTAESCTQPGLTPTVAPVDVFGVPFPVCVVDAQLLTDLTFTNDQVYLLLEPTYVGGNPALDTQAPTPVTLTVQEGTQIVGGRGTGSLVVSRASQVQMVGTPDLPIVMSGTSAFIGETLSPSADITDLTERGEWGGLVLSGYAPLNVQPDETSGFQFDWSEFGGNEVWAGGGEPTDSSGTVQYVVIAEAGFERQVGSFPAFMMIGVGSGTTIDHIQVIGSDADAVNAIGGTVNVRHLVGQGFDDDGIDTDLGYRGSIQHALFMMGRQNGDRGLECDNNRDNFDAQPAGAPVFANLTILGDIGKDDLTIGAMHRGGWRGQVLRSVFADHPLTEGGFEAGCIDVDDALPSALTYRDVLVDCATGVTVACGDDE